MLRKFYKPSEVLVDDHLLLHKHVITFFYEIPRWKYTGMEINI